MELNSRVLSQIRGIGGDELLKRLALLYLENTPVRFEQIRRGLAAKDWKRTALAIHSIRSSSATLGAVELADRAGELERMAHEDGCEQLEGALPEFESMAREALRELEKLT